MDLVPCPNCGRPRDPASPSCPACGELARGAAVVERPCPSCGKIAAPSQRFCGECGAPLVVVVRHLTHTPPPVLDRGGGGAGTPAVLEPRGARRVVALRPDGRAAQAFNLGAEPLVCGRAAGQMRFADDPTVSSEHCRFELHGSALHLVDLGGVNGTFIRIQAPRALTIGDELRLGRQLLRLEAMPHAKEAAGPLPWGRPDPGYRARVVQLLEGGGTGEVFPLVLGENSVGRDAARVCFPGDRFVSARHARFDVTPSGVSLLDLGSSNGTFVRISAPEPLAPGDQVLVGHQLLRIE